MCESLAEITKTTVLLQIFCRNANVHSDLIALKCKECVAYTIRFVSFFLLLLIRRLLLRQMYRAHQSVQINAIMVHVIHAIARRYARASVHTNKHTIKRINSHCQIHTCSCGLAELKWLYFYLAPFIHERERVKLFVVVIIIAVVLFALFSWFFSVLFFCRLCCCVNLSFDATTHFVHCMHFELFFFLLLLLLA